MPKIPDERYRLYNLDCFEVFEKLEDESVDAVICDPPYGTTQCKWDSVIPLEPMWEALRRIVKPTGAMVFTADQPFTSALVLSATDLYRYRWVWNKVNRATGFLDSHKQPLRIVEDILVFGSSRPKYNPQMTKGKPYATLRTRVRESKNYGRQRPVSTVNSGERYPVNLLNIKAAQRKRDHPTKKPLELMEYLVKTYTDEGDLVLDFAMGSGTTGVACGRLGRRFIGCDNDKEFGYFKIASERIAKAYERGPVGTQR